MGAIETMADVIRHQAAERPDAVALVSGDRSWTYAEMDAESSRIAQALLDAGVRPQERVAYLDKNAPEYFTYLFGAAKVNAVTVAVNWRLAPPEMAHILEDSGARVLLVGEEFLDHLDKGGVDGIEHVIVLGSSASRPTYAEWIEGREALDPAVPSAPDDVCYQLYTSGTTGLPKGVQLTNSNMFRLMPAASEEWGFGPDAVNLVAMPLFHIAGSGWGIVGLFNGARTILLRDVDPAEILRVIPAHGVTVALFVPAVLQFLLAMPNVGDVDFSTLEMIVYGASPITESVLVDSIRTFDCDFIQAYGLTETTGGVVILRPEDHDPGGPNAHLLRAAGRPWGDVELRIAEPETMRELPDGEVGEVLVRSGQIMKGYWNLDDETAKVMTPDGWFRTGDAGYLRDGYLYIHDRVKDMIVSGGENIYPAEIENALIRHPGIADLAVIGVPDDRWGETPKAMVVRTDPDLDQAAVIAFAREHLAGYKCPTSVEFIDAIPRNASGKILKTDLRAPYWEGRDRKV
ncbi:MAG: long-chain-fatty-acid--CoA ligase [Actinomycetota bacterium]|nr:long-chain-fatty-acid--CoA ligase [Actinomycetota bacterium]